MALTAGVVDYPPSWSAQKRKSQLVRIGFTDENLAGNQAWLGTSSVFSENAEIQSWIDVVRQVQSLLNLETNWDGHGGRIIHVDCARFALQLLRNILGPNTPPPSIVPLSYGGLQIEWHECDIDLEIEVVSPNVVIASFADSRSGATFEDVQLSNDFGELNRPISELTERSTAKPA